MFNREHHIRANRQGRAKLQGEQQRLAFPRRGRPSRFRTLERAGQMRLTLRAGHETKVSRHETKGPSEETLDAALQMTFPVGPVGEDELEREFNRLFPAPDRVPGDNS